MRVVGSDGHRSRKRYCGTWGSVDEVLCVNPVYDNPDGYVFRIYIFMVFNLLRFGSRLDKQFRYS